ncbi:MAG TPA: VOC family protein [Propionibacteriaceae bacterium]|nr:VOC family protein [Propionibacteriaceae bacterium]
MTTNLVSGSESHIGCPVGPTSIGRLIGSGHTDVVMDVLQVAQHADDLDRARDFYSRLLGAQPAGFFDPPGLLFFQAGSVRLLLEQGAPSALLYLKVDDLGATVEKLRAEGVEIIADPELIFTHTDDRLGPAGTAEHMAFFRDSEGNTVGLVGHGPA